MFQILVVDDDRNTRLLFKAILESEGYTVFAASNGIEAMEVMDQNHIDLVVLDIMMPEMDGYEFTKGLREADKNLPILMVSAKQLPQDKKKGFLVGPDDYMAKPFSPKELLLRVGIILRRNASPQAMLSQKLVSDNIHIDINDSKQDICIYGDIGYYQPDSEGI